MIDLPDPVPGNVRDRESIEQHVAEFLARGGAVKKYGVTRSVPDMSRRESDSRSGARKNGQIAKRTNDATR